MIVGIAGEAGSGKGTAAEVLAERGYIRGKFAGALKEMLRALLHYQGVQQIDRYIEGDLKEVPSKYLGGKSPRHVMQWLGHSGRENIGDDFWIDVELRKLEGLPKVLFDDLRYDNEEAAIVARGGLVLQLVGRGGINGDHISEQFKPKNPAMVIENTGTIEDLQKQINTFADDISWINVNVAA
jgi:hypothetical protein